jgi:RNA polymerase primary sigma factor
MDCQTDNFDFDVGQDILRDEMDMVLSDTVRQYLNQAGKFKLLTAEEEVELGRQIQAGYNADKADPQYDRIVAKGKLAENALTEHNLKLVVSIAKKYQRRGVCGLSLLDLVQEGNLGLMRAARGFDPESGNKFSTYATLWIRQAIERGIADKGQVVRIPVHIHERINVISRIRRELEMEGVPATTETIANRTSGRTKMTPSQIEELLLYAEAPISIESPIVGDNDKDVSIVADFIPDTKAESPEEEAITQDLEMRVDKLLDRLPERSAKVLRMRFGIGKYRPHTLEEIGEELGVTRERVRQIQEEAIRRLRVPAGQMLK